MPLLIVREKRENKDLTNRILHISGAGDFKGEKKMQIFSRAIVRDPGASIQDAITSVSMGMPDPERARLQHSVYVQALRDLDVDVMVLPSSEVFPDSVFVEDTAVFLDHAVVITRPGALERRGETEMIRPFLESLDREVITIFSPGTLDGGDVLLAGKSFFVGISERTNAEGFKQFSAAVSRYSYDAHAVPLASGLHLKSGISLVEEGLLLTAPGCGMDPIFDSFEKILTPEDECYAANCIYVNGSILVAAGFPGTASALVKRGLEIREVAVDEFQKVDGGLSCLSLRF